MVYEAKDYSALLGTPGFSDQLLNNHFKLYQGYVKNTNKVAEILAQMAKDGKMGAPEYNELKRRFGWEFNGMRLHELYFGNMKNGGAELPKDGELAKALAARFGSVEEWEKDFRGTGGMRGIGWVVLYADGDELFNCWINEHDLGHLAGVTPLLIMDVFEHAFMIDYGLNKGEYIDAFFKAIDWSVVEGRFKNRK